MAKTLPFYEMMDSNPLKIQHHKEHREKQKRKKKKKVPRTSAPSYTVAKK